MSGLPGGKKPGNQYGDKPPGLGAFSSVPPQVLEASTYAPPRYAQEAASFQPVDRSRQSRPVHQSTRPDPNHTPRVTPQIRSYDVPGSPYNESYTYQNDAINATLYNSGQGQGRGYSNTGTYGKNYIAAPGPYLYQASPSSPQYQQPQPPVSSPGFNMNPAAWNNNPSMMYGGNNLGGTISQRDPTAFSQPLPTGGQFEGLNSLGKYQGFSKMSPSYFQVGVIFETEWPEPMSDIVNLQSTSSHQYYVNVYKFIVVEKRWNHVQTVCIHTYGERGAVRKQHSDHCIVFVKDRKHPGPQKGERQSEKTRGIRTTSIAVEPHDKGAPFSTFSRINLGKYIPVDVGCRVRPWGAVCNPSLVDLQDLLVDVNRYWREKNGL